MNEMEEFRPAHHERCTAHLRGEKVLQDVGIRPHRPDEAVEQGGTAIQEQQETRCQQIGLRDVPGSAFEGAELAGAKHVAWFPQLRHDGIFHRQGLRQRQADAFARAGVEVAAGIAG
jgi:hypothetical protein